MAVDSSGSDGSGAGLAVWAAGQGVTLRIAVDLAESQGAEAFADRPLAEASVREILGLTYRNPGAAAQAVTQYERAFALREAMQGVNHTQSLLGEAPLDQKKLADAERLLLAGYEGMKQREDTVPSQDPFRLTKARQGKV